MRQAARQLVIDLKDTLGNKKLIAMQLIKKHMKATRYTAKKVEDARMEIELCHEIIYENL